MMQQHVQVDGKVRTDTTYPAGFMDVITLEATNEHFRLVYDVKGKFAVHRISAEEAAYKLGKVKKVQLGKKGVPYVVTHDGRTIRYPDPLIRANDTVKIDLATGKIDDFIKFDTGRLVMVTGGRNLGRVGVIVHRENTKEVSIWSTSKMLWKTLSLPDCLTFSLLVLKPVNHGSHYQRVKVSNCLFLKKETEEELNKVCKFYSHYKKKIVLVKIEKPT